MVSTPRRSGGSNVEEETGVSPRRLQCVYNAQLQPLTGDGDWRLPAAVVQEARYGALIDSTLAAVYSVSRDRRRFETVPFGPVLANLLGVLDAGRQTARLCAAVLESIPRAAANQNA
jgi:hypothetical protein